MATQSSPLQYLLPELEVDVNEVHDPECNFYIAGQSSSNDEDHEEFIVSAIGCSEEKTLYETVPYCGRWKASSGLFLAKKQMIQRAYGHRKELGLFQLFLNGSFLSGMRLWTSNGLQRRGKKTKPLRMDEMLAYLGLELATSLHRMNKLRGFWSTSELLHIPLFKKVMSRDLFLNIRAALRLYSSYEADIAARDPLWHSRQILEHFAGNSATLAVPVGVSSLDENNIRCKGRTAVRSYMKSKPVKFGIRFYAVVGWSHAYLHSFEDNGSGNKSGQTPVERYTTVFRSLRGAVERKIDGKLVAKSTASALWCTQMAHQTQLRPTPRERRLMVMDNFYTRHVMARQLNALSDGECKVLGTVRFNNVDGMNRPALKEAIESMKHAERGEWRLLQVYHKSKRDSDPPQVVERTGFVVFKDRTVVTFYTNDLADTPYLRIYKADNHAVSCVHGLAPLKRWIGTESFTRTILQVPSIIVSYNLFMNGVDRFDQFRSTAATLRREKRVPMSILTFVLDACILNAYALLKAIFPTGEPVIDVVTMKHRIILQLVAEYDSYNKQRATLDLISQPGTTNTNQRISSLSTSEPHMLLETEGRKNVRCVLCKNLSSTRHRGYTNFSCSQCKSGFHVNCFYFYHHKDHFRDTRPDTHDAVVRAEGALNSEKRRNRQNHVTSTIESAKVVS